MSCHCNHAHSEQNHAGCCGNSCHAAPEPLELTAAEADVLRRFAQIPFQPLARFLMVSSTEDDLESVGLSAVHLDRADEPLEQVRETASLLRQLEEKGLITLDYDIPLNGYDYAIYRTSSAYQLFVRTVQDGARREGFLFDTPELELGSMALTALGRSVVEQLDHL